MVRVKKLLFFQGQSHIPIYVDVGLKGFHPAREWAT